MGRRWGRDLPGVHAALKPTEVRRKNSFRGRPSIEPPAISLAPVSETSCIVHGRCHVPSIAIMFAENPRSNTTRCALRCFISSIHLKYKKNDEREQSVDRSRYALPDPRLIECTAGRLTNGGGRGAVARLTHLGERGCYRMRRNVQTKFARPKQSGALVVFMMELALLSSVGFFG